MFVSHVAAARSGAKQPVELETVKLTVGQRRTSTSQLQNDRARAHYLLIVSCIAEALLS
jgi:hypothetical protein